MELEHYWSPEEREAYRAGRLRYEGEGDESGMLYAAAVCELSAEIDRLRVLLKRRATSRL